MFSRPFNNKKQAMPDLSPHGKHLSIACHYIIFLLFLVFHYLEE